MTFKAKPKRPKVLTNGTVWMEPIEEILKRESIDRGAPGKWERLLNDKRNDEWYEDVLDSLRDNGFVRPLTAGIVDKGRDYKFGDGHHRLAAAIDLGLTHVPLEAWDSCWDSISYESGFWLAGSEIPTSNRVAAGYEEE